MTTMQEFEIYLTRFNRRRSGSQLCMWWIIPGTHYHDALNIDYADAGDTLERPEVLMSAFYLDIKYSERYR